MCWIIHPQHLDLVKGNIHNRLMQPNPSKNIPADLSPETLIAQFCRTHPSWAVKGELWKWRVHALKSRGIVNAHVQTPEFVAFYEDLNALLTAVYKMYGDGGQ